MELVNINLFAEGYYSGRTYEDNIWIKKSSYEKLMDIFPEEISCGELDGKHSEVMGKVDVQDYSYTDEYYAKNADIAHDGDYLGWSLCDLYESNGLDWVEEQNEINEYLSHLDLYEEVTVSVPLNERKTSTDGLRVLSLCGGVETGLYALQQLGIQVKEYHTYEILSEAIAVSQYHFPFVIHHGDLYEADFNQFKGFDLLLAGTCCQSLSKVRIEDKQVNNGLDGKSGIFFKAIECLKAIQPKYFMFENVIPSREEDLNTMTKCIGVDPLLINSAIFSAQSRERYY